MKDHPELKEEEISEKVFWQQLFITVISILVCLIMLCSTTFAWFSATQSTSEHKLTSGNFALTVQLNGRIDGTVQDVPIEPTMLNPNNGVCRYKLACGEYLVLLTLDEESTAKGHCVVSINGVKKYTEVIIGEKTVNKDAYTENSPLSFLLVIDEDDTVVTFTPHWGMASDPSLYHKEIYHSGQWQPLP